MRDTEIQQFIAEIFARHQGDIRNLDSEMTIGQGRHIYNLRHNNLECEFELIEKESFKFSRVRIGDFEGDYSEGTVIYDLIVELLLEI